MSAPGRTTLLAKYASPSALFNHAVLEHPDDANFSTHIHDVIELIYLKSGKISAIIGEKTYKLKKGSLVIFRPNIPHRIRIDGSDEAYERYNIILDENEFAQGEFSAIPKEIDVIDCSMSEIIAGLFTKLDVYYAHFEGLHLDILIKCLLEELILNLILMSKHEAHNAQLTVQPLVGKAVTFINEHYRDPISVEDICVHLNITKSYLHQLFMKELQISPKKYINVRRLARAQKLIRRGEKPSNIYMDCGFTEYATFFRNYLSYFGHTPSQENSILPERKIES